MLHEHLQRHIVGEDDVTAPPSHPCAVVRRAGVKLGEQEARLAPVLVAVHQPRHREPLPQNLLSVRLGRLEELLERLMLGLILVVGLAPLRDGLTVEDDHREVRIQDQDPVRRDGAHVEQHRLGGPVERVRHQRGLDHDQRVQHVLAPQNHAVVRSLVRGVVEHLDELGPAQVEHELGVDGELGHELERRRVVLAVVPEPLAHADERTIQPPGRRGAVELILRLHLPRELPGDERRASLLVETRRDVVHVGTLRPPPRGGGDPQARLPCGHRAHGDKLQEELLRLLLGRGLRPVLPVAPVRGLEEHREAGVVAQRAQLPRGGTPAAHGYIRDCSRECLFVQRRARPHASRGLDVPRGDHLEDAAAAHPERVLPVRREHPGKRRLEDGVGKRLREHHHPPSLLRAHLHLRQTHLIERAREHVEAVPVGAQLCRHRLVVLGRLGHERRRALGDVLVRAHRRLELLTHNLAAAVRRGTAHEQQRTRGGVGDGGCEQRRRHRHRGSRAPRRPAVGEGAERIPGELLEHRRELKLAVGEGHQKLGLVPSRRRRRLTGLRGPGAPRGPEQLVLDLLRRKLFRSPEHVRLGALVKPELVDVHVRPEGDQAHRRVLRQQRQRLRQGLLQRPEFFLDEAHVNHEEVRGRRGGGSLELVLDGGVRGEQFRGEVGLADGRVVLREVVAGVAEGADPELSGEVHPRVRVEARRATLAPNRIVGHDRHLGQNLARGDQRAERNDTLLRLHLGVGPDVPVVVGRLGEGGAEVRSGSGFGSGAPVP